MSGFIEAVNVHGRKQVIPAAWLDHPTIGKGFRLPPSARAGAKAEAPAPAPTIKTPPAGDKE